MDHNQTELCPCGSGLPRRWEYDGRATPLFQACPRCREGQLQRFLQPSPMDRPFRITTTSYRAGGTFNPQTRRVAQAAPVLKNFRGWLIDDVIIRCSAMPYPRYRYGTVELIVDGKILVGAGETTASRPDEPAGKASREAQFLNPPPPPPHPRRGGLPGGAGGTGRRGRRGHRCLAFRTTYQSFNCLR